MPRPAIIPFWQRLPELFKLPLQGRNLGVLLLATVLGGVAPLLHPSLMLAFFVAVVIGVMRYCLTVMEFTAYGYIQPADYPLRKLSGSYTFLKLLGALFLMGLVMGLLLYPLGKAGNILGSVTSSLISPAMVMLVVMTESMLAGLNPLRLTSLMLRIGKPYLILIAFLFLAQLSMVASVQVAVKWIPRAILLPAVLFSALYFSLMMFIMMGYVLYQKHEELGFNASGDGEASPEQEAEDELEALDTRIQQFLDDDNMPAALGWMHDAVGDRPDDMARHERYHRLLALAGDKRLLQHAGDYLGRLLVARKPLELFKVLENCWQQDPAWIPPAHLRVPLAQLCMERGRIKDALRLLKDFHKQHPTAPEIPDAWLLQARILIERYNKDEQAAPFLKAISTRYSEHPAAAKAQALLRAITANG